MGKIFLIYYRNVSSISMEIFELTDDNIKYNKPWPIDVDVNQTGVIDADVNYNPRRQDLYNEFVCALVKRYGNQTVEDIPNLPLTRILDLAGDKRYPYNNGFYYICEADNPLELMHRFYTVMCKAVLLGRSANYIFGAVQYSVMLEKVKRLEESNET